MRAPGFVVDLQSAFMLLTRLPVGRGLSEGAPDLARAVWAYPIVGAVVGAAGAAAYWAAARSGLPPSVAAVLALVTLVLVTGAFHEDGLADTADGIGGGGTVERKLEIMRDSRIGTYGTVAVVLSLGLRGVAITSLGGVGTAVLGLIAAGAVSRGVIVVLLALLPAARRDGMGAVAQGPPWWAVGLGLVLATAPALLCWRVAPAALAGLAAGYWLGRRYLGGYTGDLLGAAQQVAECACLIALAS